jgi:hypothetical protein
MLSKNRRRSQRQHTAMMNEKIGDLIATGIQTVVGVVRGVAAVMLALALFNPFSSGSNSGRIGDRSLVAVTLSVLFGGFADDAIPLQFTMNRVSRVSARR